MIKSKEVWMHGLHTRLALAGLVALGALGVAVPAGAEPRGSEAFTGSVVSDTKWVVGSPRGADAPCLTAATSDQAGSLRACREVLAGTKAPDAEGQGAFRLTDNSRQNAGSLLLNEPLNATRGLTVEFDMYQYSSNPGTNSYGTYGADGISFFLVDGAQDKVDPGDAGGMLGYRGLSGAFMGVGFDLYGNFSAWGGGPGRAPNSVVLRGGESTGYTYVERKALDPVTQRLGAEYETTREKAKRHVVIDVATDGIMRVYMNFQDGEGLQLLLEENLNTLPGQEKLPETVKLGWAAATGDSTSVHEISGFLARTLDPDLTVSSSADGPWQAGGTGAYTLDVAASAKYGYSDDVISLTHEVPEGVTPTAASGDGWTCKIEGQLVTCTSDKEVAPGTSYPPLKIDVKVAAAAVGHLTSNTKVAIPSDVPGGIEVDTSNNTATATVTISPIPPDLTLVLDAPTPWVAGGMGHLTARVNNDLTAGPTTGLTTLEIPAPEHARIVEATGDGWTCKLNKKRSAVICTRTDLLLPGQAFPPVDVAFDVDACGCASSPVSGDVWTVGEEDLSDNHDTVAVAIIESTAPDLMPVVEGPQGLRRGETGIYYLTVHNQGKGATNGLVTAYMKVPGIRMKPVAASGDGWSCSVSDLAATCTRLGYGADALAAKSTYPDIKMDFQMKADADPGYASASAHVENDQDMNAANDIDRLPRIDVLE